jgi:hypothetical protein
VKASNNGKPDQMVDVMAEKILAALEKSRRFFPDLLALFAKENYRTISMAVGYLHEQGKIIQDGEGKYQIKE